MTTNALFKPFFAPLFTPLFSDLFESPSVSDADETPQSPLYSIQFADGSAIQFVDGSTIDFRSN